MRKRRFYLVFVALSLAIIITGASVGSTIATHRYPAPVDPNVAISHDNAANVFLNLPPGGGALAGHPTNIRFVVYDYDGLKNNGDSMTVYIWIASTNSYVPVAVIRDQAPTAGATAFWNNTPVYLEVNGVVMRNNLKTVADNQLDVWIESGNNDHKTVDIVLMVNLTVPVPLDFTGLPSAVFGSAFAVPPTTLMFRGIADGFHHEETFTVPSGYKLLTVHTDVPAWVRATIPTWVGLSEVVGTILYRDTTTITPPA
jgi:hypothetical protein